MVGAGRVAALLLEAYRTVRTIDRVTVWARQPAAADALALAWRAQGLPATVAPDMAAAVATADIVGCAMLFIGNDEALADSGDLLGPMSRGVFQADDAAARFDQLCRGQHPGQRRAAERTVFKSVGTALEDLGAAGLDFNEVTTREDRRRAD